MGRALNGQQWRDADYCRAGYERGETNAKYARRFVHSQVANTGSRKAKARMGLYAGDRVPVGYVVLCDQSTDRLNHYAIYEPQAQMIRLIFAKFLELRRIQAVARWCSGMR